MVTKTGAKQEETLLVRKLVAGSRGPEQCFEKLYEAIKAGALHLEVVLTLAKRVDNKQLRRCLVVRPFLDYSQLWCLAEVEGFQLDFVQNILKGMSFGIKSSFYSWSDLFSLAGRVPNGGKAEAYSMIFREWCFSVEEAIEICRQLGNTQVWLAAVRWYATLPGVTESQILSIGNAVDAKHYQLAMFVWQIVIESPKISARTRPKINLRLRELDRLLRHDRGRASDRVAVIGTIEPAPAARKPVQRTDCLY